MFCKVVAVAPAVVRRDGRVQAEGKPCDYARLGVLEERLDMIAGPDAIGRLARSVRLDGKVKGLATRLMTTAFALRAILLMTLMPVGYGEVMTALAGDLAAVPWSRPWHVPSATVLSAWRDAIGPEPLESLQQAVLAACCADHRDHDYRAVRAGGLRAGAIDGTLTRMPDTAANRAAYGSAGTADDSAPYPQLRSLLLTDASTRGTLGVVCGPCGGDKAEAEQKLLDKAMTEFAWLFTGDRLWIMDRNFPGTARISRMIARTHVLIRVKSDIPLRRAGDFLPDGSYLADICGGGVTVRVRVIEYDVEVDGQDVPEMFCLITDLTDWRAYPAADLARAYRWRWDGRRRRCARTSPRLTAPGPRPADVPVKIPPPDPPGARRLDHRHRTGPRHRPRRRPPGRPRRQGRPRRATGSPPRDLLHRRPPSRDHLRPARDRHRRAAPPAHLSSLPGRDRRNRPVPRPGRPQPAPRPQDQSPPGVPERAASAANPHRSRRDHHLRCRRLSTRHARPRTARRPVEPAAPRSDSRAPIMPANRPHAPYNTSRSPPTRALHPQTPKSLISTALPPSH